MRVSEGILYNKEVIKINAQSIVDFIFNHQIISAVILLIILIVTANARDNKRKDDQMKDNYYGSVNGYVGRKIDRQAKQRNDNTFFGLASMAILVFIGYKIFKIIANIFR